MKRILSIYIFLQLLNTNLWVEELIYGSHIKKLTTTDISGEKVLIPQNGFLTLLYFISLDRTDHIRALSELDFIIINLNKTNEKIKLLVVSKNETKKFLELKIMAPRHNLWVTFGSGSCPSV